jgi:hypothetical protein
MNSPNHHRLISHQKPLRRPSQKTQYESKKDQPCPSICELEHAVFCCDLLEGHRSDVHRADLIDKRGGTVIVTWKERR